MKKYQPHPHIPDFVAAMNGELLISSHLDVLDFIHRCKKYGCRTSNRRIGIYTHHSRETVKRAIQKLYALNLVAIDNYGKRTRNVKPVPWTDRETWEKYQKMQAKSETDLAQNEPHIPHRQDTPPKGGVSMGVSESTFQVDDFSSRGLHPRTPARCSVGGGSSETSATPKKVDIPFAPQGEIPMPTYQEAAIEMRDKLIKVGWTREQAERKTQKRYPEAKF